MHVMIVNHIVLSCFPQVAGFVVPCPANIMLNYCALLQDLHSHANLFSVGVVLRHDNTKGHHLKPTLVSIFGLVLSGLWLSLPTTAELFRIPAHDLLRHLLMFLTKTESSDAWMSPASLWKYSTHHVSVYFKTYICFHLGMQYEVWELKVSQGTDWARAGHLSPSTPALSLSEGVTSWAQHFESTLFTDLQIKKKKDEKVSI